jgi:hypothetical protein
LINTSEEQTFVSQKVNFAVGSPDWALYSLVSASQAKDVGGRAGAAG